MASFLTTVTEEAGLLQLLSAKTHCVLNFFASWDEATDAGIQMVSVLEALSTRYTNMSFLKIDAEASPTLSEKYKVTVVPTFILICAGKVVTKLEGSNPPELSKIVKTLSEIPAPKPSENEVHHFQTFLILFYCLE